ncbi:MAG: hypothetical protein HYT94_00100 [Parcubacteria group bacterium]|nr:hypothetical protein [Parcubacteria group bacterium]
MKKMRRQNKERRKRTAKYAVENTAGNINAYEMKRVAVPESKPAPEGKTSGQSFNAWLSEMTDNELRIWTLLCYCAGVSLYSAFSMVAGYTFWKTCAVFAGAAFTGIITHLCVLIYIVCVRRNRVFGSYRSWFMRFDDFLEDDFERFAERIAIKTNRWSNEDIYGKVIVIILFLPIFGLAGGMVAALLVFILLLDWMRLAVIGLANLCFTATPSNAALGLCLGVSYGAAIATYVNWGLKFNPSLFIILIGGMAGACASLYKEVRKQRYGSPYFPV